MSHADELKVLADDVLSVLGTGTDSDGVGEGVTFRMVRTAAKNYTTGTPVQTTADLSLAAVIGPVRTFNLGGSDDRGVVEEREFTLSAAAYRAALAAASITYRDPAEQDSVLVALVGGGSDEWPVVRAHAEVSGRLWRVRCRRMR